MTHDVRIEPATARDRDAVIALLASHALPPDGLTGHWPTTLVARDGGRVVGSAAVELYADGALLRSVAVAPGLQGHGVGRRLTEAALRLAQDHHASAVFLLTTTAEHYFPQFGFERITRSDVPQSVQASIEFVSACPASAVVMRRLL